MKNLENKTKEQLLKEVDHLRANEGICWQRAYNQRFAKQN